MELGQGRLHELALRIQESVRIEDFCVWTPDLGKTHMVSNGRWL